MRRRRSHRSSRKSNRKVYWNGFVFGGASISFRPSFGRGDVATLWAKWPSNQQDFGTSSDVEGTEGFQTPSDETLVKTLLNSEVHWQVDNPPNDHKLTIVVGLIPWMSRNATELEAVQTVNTVPNPAYEWSADWIIRQPYVMSLPNFYKTATTAQFQESRAMRKLPPDTGILCCIGVGDPLGGTEDEVVLDWIVDGRLCLKSGYYSIG